MKLYTHGTSNYLGHMFLNHCCCFHKDWLLTVTGQLDNQLSSFVHKRGILICFNACSKQCVPQSFCFLDIFPFNIKLHLIAISMDRKAPKEKQVSYDTPASPQQPLSIVPKVAVVERFDCICNTMQRRGVLEPVVSGYAPLISQNPSQVYFVSFENVDGRTSSVCIIPSYNFHLRK